LEEEPEHVTALTLLQTVPHFDTLKLWLKMKAAVCTIVAKNYLPYARVLMDSVRLWNPALLRVVVLVDRIDGCFNPSDEDFALIVSEDLNIPKSKWFHFKYTILELSTAIKPYALEFLLHRYELDKVIFLDPDIKLYASLQGILDRLEDYSILLTPHLTGVLEDDFRPSDLDILRSGTYNLGFLALASRPETFSFLEWWRKRLYDLCVVDLPRGLFVDQRWVDLVPGLFSGVGIIREPGYNVAYWNLGLRNIEWREGQLRVNGEPLCFFHFSGFDPTEPEQFSRHQNRFRLSMLNRPTQELILEYCGGLLSRGFEECRNWPYAYSRFQNGFAIPDVGRPLHHEASELANVLEDPFGEEGFRAFVETWNQPIMEEHRTGTGISTLAYRIYRTRTDVQAAMPDIFGGDRFRFLEWMSSTGKSEHGLSDVFLAPVWDALAAARKHKRGNGHSDHNSVLNSIQGLDHRTVGQVERLNEYIAEGKPTLKLTRLARIIYESRPELQRFFPDPCGRDSVKFLVWLLTYGKKEHLLTEPYLAPLRSQWEQVLASLGHWRTRAWYRLLLIGMASSVTVRTFGAAASSKVRRAKTRAWLYLHRIPQRGAAAETEGQHPSSTSEAMPNNGNVGLNLVGYLRAEMGVGESARAAAKAALAAGIPLALRNIDSTGGQRSEDYSAGPTRDGLPYPITVFHVNADQTNVVHASLDQDRQCQHYNVGCWAWELSRFPDRWTSAFDYYQEIWTPSTFCVASIAQKSPIPVIHIPHAIDVDVSPSLGREYFGLPTDRFIFLTLFDMLSVFARKNPLGTIQAFATAFGHDTSVHLVVKVNNGQRFPNQFTILQERAAEYRITVIDSTFTRPETQNFINVCDCLVSLHRSEGFGLTLAEAMFLGKPVIATAYSGNMDFTTSDNSFLVPYSLIPVGKDNEPYDEDCLWADPCIEQAAQHMRTVIADVAARTRIAAAGQEYVRRTLSPEAVGSRIADRLRIIQSRLSRTPGQKQQPARLKCR